MLSCDRIKRFLIIISITSLITITWILLPFKISVVKSHSVKYSIVFYQENVSSLKKGDYILFKWKGKDPQNKGLLNGMILIKKISCMENDFLQVNKDQYFCNGQPKEMLSAFDSQGKLVFPFLYTGKIPKNKFFVIGDNLMSYDSRYWGFIDKSQIIGRVYFGL